MSETERPRPVYRQRPLRGLGFADIGGPIQIRYPVPIERFTKALDGMCYIGCPACGEDGDDVLVQDDLGEEVTHDRNRRQIDAASERRAAAYARCAPGRPVLNRASDLAYEPSGARPGPHQPAHGGGRAEPGSESSAYGDLLRLANVELPKGTRLNLQGQPP